MKKLLLALTGALAIIVAFDTYNNKAFTWSAQAPDGKTDSPGDGGNCTGCHAGVAVPTNNLIQSDIPSSGYVPGTTYTIGCGLSTGASKYGFQVSPQDASGNLIGTLTAGTNNLVSSDKYVTHNGPFIGSVAVWSFEWTAPVAGTGDVTFYGSFLAADGNSSTSGDQVLTSTMTVSEDVAASINGTIANEIKVYPTTVMNHLNIENAKGGKLHIYDMQGKKVLDQEIDKDKFSVNDLILNAGMYVVKVVVNGEETTTKILKQ